MLGKLLSIFRRDPQGVATAASPIVSTTASSVNDTLVKPSLPMSERARAYTHRLFGLLENMNPDPTYEQEVKSLITEFDEMLLSGGQDPAGCYNLGEHIAKSIPPDKSSKDILHFIKKLTTEHKHVEFVRDKILSLCFTEARERGPHEFGEFLVAVNENLFIRNAHKEQLQKLILGGGLPDISTLSEEDGTNIYGSIGNMEEGWGKNYMALSRYTRLYAVYPSEKLGDKIKRVNQQMDASDSANLRKNSLEKIDAAVDILERNSYKEFLTAIEGLQIFKREDEGGGNRYIAYLLLGEIYRRLMHGEPDEASRKQYEIEYGKYVKAISELEGNNPDIKKSVDPKFFFY